MPYAVVTGASSGIGKEFAIQLSKLNYELILVARRKEKLQETSKLLKNPSLIYEVDLAKEEECRDFFEKIKDLDIAIFINNAGFGECGEFIKIDDKLELQMIDVNVKAMHLLTKLALNKLKNQQAYILNVASISGLFPAGPYMSTYYATKSYIVSLTRGIAKELKDNNYPVYLGTLCPGPVNTEFNRVAHVQFALKGISSSKCVSYALKKMFQKKVIIIPTMKLKIATFLMRFCPAKLIIHLASKQQKRKLSK